MSRLSSALRIIILLLIAVSAVMSLLMMLLAVLIPDSITNLRVGSEALGSIVRDQADSVAQSAKLNPLLDVVIAGGAYIFVCLLSWSQDRLSSYLANRSHFS